MTGLTSLGILVSERHSRFFSKLYQSSLFRPLCDCIDLFVIDYIFVLFSENKYDDDDDDDDDVL